MLAYLSKSPSDSTTNTLWKSCVEEVLASSEAVLHVTPTALGRFSLGIGCFLVAILRSLLILCCFVSPVVSVVYSHKSHASRRDTAPL